MLKSSVESRRKLEKEYRFISAYAPSLQLNQKDLDEYQNAKTLNSFMKKFSSKLFDGGAVLGIGVDMYGDKLKDQGDALVEKNSRVARKVFEDIELLRQNFVMKESFQEKMNDFRVIAANIDRMERDGVSHDQVMKYYRLSLDLIPIALIDLERDTTCLQESLRSLSAVVGDNEQGIAKNRHLIEGLVDNVSSELNSIECDLGELLKNQLSEIELSELNREDLAKLHEVFDQFGIELQQNSKEQKIMQQHLLALVSAFEEQQRAQQQQLFYDSARQAMGGIALIGQVFDKPEFITAGSVGLELINVVENVNKLAECGFTGLVSLAAFGPLCAIFTASLSIVGLFRRQKNKEIQALMRELRYLRQVLHKMDQKLDRILVSVDTLIDMVSEVRVLIFDGIHSINSAIVQNRMSNIVIQIEELQCQLKLLLKKDLGLMSADLRALSEYADELEVWLFERASDSLFSGKSQVMGARGEHFVASVNNAFFAQFPHSYLIGLLGVILQGNDADFPEEVNVSELFNVDIWMMVVSKYLEVTSMLKEHGYTREGVGQLKKMFDNQCRFLKYLLFSGSVYSTFYRLYWDSLDQFDALLKQKFRQTKFAGCNSNKTSLSLMSKADSIDCAIEKVAQQIEAFAKVIWVCAEVSGLGNILNKLMPSENYASLMGVSRDWQNHELTFENIGAKHGSAQLVQNGEPIIYYFSKDNAKIQIAGYSVTKRESLSEGSYSLAELNSDYENLKAVNIAVNGKQVLYVVLYSLREAAVYQFDPGNKDPWQYILQTTLERGACAVDINVLTIEGSERLIVSALKINNYEKGISHHTLYKLDNQEYVWQVRSSSLTVSQRYQRRDQSNSFMKEHAFLYSTHRVRYGGKECLYSMVQTKEGRFPICYDPAQDLESSWGECTLGMVEIEPYSLKYASHISKTLQDQVWDNGGENKLLTCINYNGETLLYCFDPSTNNWEKLSKPNFPHRDFKWNFPGPKYTSVYTNFKSTMLMVNGVEHFVLAVRTFDGLQMHAYNVLSGQTIPIHDPEIWSNANGYDAPCFHGELRCYSVDVTTQHQELIVSMPKEGRLNVFQLQVLEPHVPVRQKDQVQRIQQQQQLISEGKMLDQYNVRGEVVPLSEYALKMLTVSQKICAEEKFLGINRVNKDSVGCTLM